MIPTPAIEHLLSIVLSGRRRLVSQEATQILIPVFPPNTTLSFTAGPLAGDYGQIVYALGFGHNMVPNAFTGYVQIWGTRQITGTFTATTLLTEFQSFAWVTRAEPVLIYLTNVSGLNQVCEVANASLRIATEEDYDAVIEELKHMATSQEAEKLMREANQLLAVLTGGAPSPQPPLRSKG